jgi:hypothetical protein
VTVKNVLLETSFKLRASMKTQREPSTDGRMNELDWLELATDEFGLVVLACMAVGFMVYGVIWTIGWIFEKVAGG